MSAYIMIFLKHTIGILNRRRIFVNNIVDAKETTGFDLSEQTAMC